MTYPGSLVGDSDPNDALEELLLLLRFVPHEVLLGSTAEFAQKVRVSGPSGTSDSIQVGPEDRTGRLMGHEWMMWGFHKWYH